MEIFYHLLQLFLIISLPFLTVFNFTFNSVKIVKTDISVKIS